MKRFRVLEFLGGLLVSILAVAGQVRGTNAADIASVRSQYTASQWKELTSVQFIPLILPAYLPPGFHVYGVSRDDWQAESRREKQFWKELKRTPPPSQEAQNLLIDGFEVIYINDSGQKITWRMLNGRAGADIEPKQLQYAFHSVIIGDNVVKFDQPAPGLDCWTSSNLNGPHGGTNEGIFPKPTWTSWDLRSCTESTQRHQEVPPVAPGELAKMAQSVIRLGFTGFLDMNGEESVVKAKIRTPRGNNAQLFPQPCTVDGVTAIKGGTSVYIILFAEGASTFNCEGSRQVWIANGTWVLILLVPSRGDIHRWYTKTENIDVKY